jgi:hypothetical protein
VEGGRDAGLTLAAGDPLWSWVYQAGARTFRMAEAGDDRVFLDAGLPALRLSTRRFLARDPHDQSATDTAENLDAASLAATGQVVLGALAVLQNAAKPDAADADWFLRFGQVAGRTELLGAGLVSLLPGLLLALKGPRLSLPLRVVHAVVFGGLLYAMPVLAVFCFFLWNVLTAFGPRRLGLGVGALPVLTLLALGALLWSRGAVTGVHTPVWALVVAVLAAALALASGRKPARGTRRNGAGKNKGLTKH